MSPSPSSTDHNTVELTSDVTDKSIFTHIDGSNGGKVFTSVCLCVCLFFRTTSQKPMELRSPSLT